MKNKLPRVPMTILAVLFIAAAFSIYAYSAVLALTGESQWVFFGGALLFCIGFLLALVAEVYFRSQYPEKPAPRRQPAKPQRKRRK